MFMVEEQQEQLSALPEQVFGRQSLEAQYFLSRQERVLHLRLAEEEVRTVGSIWQSFHFPHSLFCSQLGQYLSFKLEVLRV